MIPCELCGSAASSDHHLVPRHCHRKPWFKRRYSREEMQRTIPLCGMCHKMIHELIPSEQELGKNYSTLEQLEAHPELANYLEWRRKRIRS